MDIKDAVAEVMYQDCLAHPDKYPSELAEWAKVVDGYNWDTVETRHEVSATWDNFKTKLARNIDSLPVEEKHE